jgi:ParB family chromosome partitioning protein
MKREPGASEGGSRKNLGRGLAALLGDENEDYASLDHLRQHKEVPVEFLRPGRFQPRQHFDKEGIDSLVESVREKGILQPILVRRAPETPNLFEIVAGERRWRAAQKAGLHEVPVLIRELSDGDALEIALVENIQRVDLGPLEEAEGYLRLIEEFAYTQETLGSAVGKSRSHVANMMRLLTLPQPVKDLIDTGELTAGHARALINATDPVKVARQVASRGLNVRQTERLVRKQRDEDGRTPAKAGGAKRGRGAKDVDTLALERDLTNLLGLKVTIRFHGAGGELTIHYGSLDQLDDVLHRLSHSEPAPKR